MSVIDYTHEYNSQLPNSPMELHHFEDINDEIAEIINQVKAYQVAKNYSAAADLITGYDLKKYMMTSEYVNLIDEETRNLEIMCKANSQSVYYMNDEPGFASVGDVWI